MPRNLPATAPVRGFRHIISALSDVGVDAKDAFDAIPPRVAAGLGIRRELNTPSIDVLAGHDKVTARTRRLEAALQKLVPRARYGAVTPLRIQRPKDPRSWTSVWRRQNRTAARARHLSMCEAGALACIRGQALEKEQVIPSSKIMVVG